MAHFSRLSVAVAIVSSVVVASHPHSFIGQVKRREEGLLESYDYVVIGAGASGLTVANRLTEDSNTTVLVIEAGDFDASEDFITIPGLAGGAVGTKYDWNITYAANEALGGRQVSIGQGKVIGGSTKLNRMVFDRGSKSDYDRWETLGNSGWNWESLFPYFKKNEIFTPASAELTAEYNITVDKDAHGYDGPMHATYSPFFWPTTKNFIAAMKELNVNTAVDQANGSPIGGYFCPHNQDPVNVTRSSAQDAYYTPVKARTNLHLLPNRQVTKLVTSTTGNGTVTVTGVEFSQSKSATRSTINVGKEALLAGGAIFTPQILQLSGIGDTALLTKFNISTAVNLPAVGQNFQDHALVTTVNTVSAPLTSSNLTSNATFAAESRALYDSEKTGPYSSPTGDFLAFLPLANYSTSSTTLQASATSQDVSAFLPANAPTEVVTGYTAQHKVLNDLLTSPDSAHLELIWADGVINLGLVQPYSRGAVEITTSDPFTLPSANPGFLTNPLDVSLLIEGVKYMRAITATSAIASLQPFEIVPGANVTSDADITTFLRGAAGTLYHPAGSCKMGKKEEGGVVDAELKVYGVERLRIVDASVMPLLPGSHTMTTVYAVAERAADLIRGKVWKEVTTTNSTECAV